MKLTLERLKQVLHYDPLTGIFTWKVAVKSYGGGRAIGAEAGTKTKGGYIRISLDKELFLAHRLAWFYTYGVMPLKGLDHEDRNGTNNRMSNLRECGQAENMQNTSPLGTGASKYRGVWWSKDKRKWVAEIKRLGKKTHLGYFAKEEDAFRAYQAAKAIIHPFYIAAS